jgi:hypothetical protein
MRGKPMKKKRMEEKRKKPMSNKEGQDVDHRMLLTNVL